jgi:hypothetical protein
MWRCDLKRGVESSTLVQKRHELIHSQQEFADVVVQHRLPQRVMGMRFAE